MNLKSKLLANYRTNKAEYVFLFVVGVLFYFLNSLSEFSWDDYYYMFICKDGNFFGNYDREYVHNFADVIKSQVNHWTYVNGRFVVHVIVQTFICLLGLPMFQVCNSLMFVLLVRNLCRLCIDSSNRNKISYYIILFAVMWILLGFMCIGLGYITSVAFAVNYLWSSALFVSYLYYYYQLKNTNDETTLFKQIGLFILAVITGAMNESFSVGLSASLFIYYLCNRNRFKGTIVLLLIGLWIGTILCCVNPANIARFSDSNSNGLLRGLLLRVFWLGSNVRLLIPIVITMILGVVSYCRDRLFFVEIYRNYVEILIAIVFTFLFLVAVGLNGNYQMFTGITLLCCILVYNFVVNIPFHRMVMFIFAICLSIHYLAVVNFSMKLNKEYNSNIKEYLSTSGIMEYQPPQPPLLVEPYGVYLKDSRKIFIYSGLELVYGYKPLFIPDRNMISKLDDGELYDADWCYVVPSQEDIKYKLVVDSFTHKNWMLKLWAKFSEQSATSFSLYSYEVVLDNRKYTIALKNNDDFIIHNVCLIKE